MWLENLKNTDCLEDLGVGGRIDLKEVGWNGRDWVNLA
jgi:hypothetical protein